MTIFINQRFPVRRDVSRIDMSKIVQDVSPLATVETPALEEVEKVIVENPEVTSQEEEVKATADTKKKK